MPRGVITEEGKARISEGQKRRWARYHEGLPPKPPKPSKPPKIKVEKPKRSPEEVKALIGAASKRRWEEWRKTHKPKPRSQAFRSQSTRGPVAGVQPKKRPGYEYIKPMHLRMPPVLAEPPRPIKTDWANNDEEVKKPYIPRSPHTRWIGGVPITQKEQMFLKLLIQGGTMAQLEARARTRDGKPWAPGIGKMILSSISSKLTRFKKRPSGSPKTAVALWYLAAEPEDLPFAPLGLA